MCPNKISAQNRQANYVSGFCGPNIHTYICVCVCMYIYINLYIYIYIYISYISLDLILLAIGYLQEEGRWGEENKGRKRCKGG